MAKARDEGWGVFAYLYICKVCVCVGLESRYACHPNLGASSPQDCHSDTQQVAMETTLIRSKTESTISRCLWGVGEGTQERLTAVLFRGRCCSRGQGQGFFICHIIVIQGITRSEMQSNQVRSVDSAKQ